MKKCGFLIMLIVMLCCTNIEAKEWRTDFKNAASVAKASGKYMLLDFSGSDWCGWCKRLDKEVFSQDAFNEFVEENLVCVLIDFPRAKKQPEKLKQQNKDLARKYDIKGYPTIIILSPDGKFVGKSGYLQGGPWEYARHLKKIIDEYKSKL
ncbi:MAG: thioredoxin family protein [Candidatus Brocadiaceae bacterium]|nr:thioredoxin family protein [Candidatus Brocadiaceae bacterium]